MGTASSGVSSEASSPRRTETFIAEYPVRFCRSAPGGRRHPAAPARPSRTPVLPVLSYSAEGGRLHVLHHPPAELRAGNLGRALHQPLEVVGHRLRADGALEALDDQVRRL